MLLEGGEIMEQVEVGIDSEALLDDRRFSEMMLLKRETTGLSKADMVFTLRNLLKLKYYPVAVKFFYDEKELEKFMLIELFIVIELIMLSILRLMM